MAMVYRDATEADVAAIVRLLADDHLGAAREDVSSPLPSSYYAAFKAITSTPYHRLLVASNEGQIVGTMQLLLVPGLSSRGAWHGQIEAVRIAADRRGHREGEAFVQWAIEQCRSAGCSSIQLLSENTRSAAHRFWKKMGFVSSHTGFKIKL